MKGQRTPPRSTPKRTCVAGVAVRAVAGRAFVAVPLVDADDAVVVGAVVTGGAVVVVVCFSRWTICYDSLHVCTLCIATIFPGNVQSMPMYLILLTPMLAGHLLCK